MREHIDPVRLFEMAQLQGLVHEPEWEHIRNCKTCLERLADLVRHEHRAEKQSDSGEHSD